MPETIGDDTRQTPETTYGATKAIGELLINDYTRKGFLDGRTARLPTVIIRPGKPNKAASGFASGVFREPLNGEPYDLPVGLETRMPVLGHRAIVACLGHLHEVDGAALGLDRVLNLPALAVTVAEMIESLKRVAAAELPNVELGEIRMAPDPSIQAIVAGWPTRTTFDRARALGMPEQDSLDTIVRDYIADFLQP
jgi:nucleoside-diphosphate-sugar epimerase